MSAVLRVLILGGTGEAGAVAHELANDPDIHTISSLAGRVRDPRLPRGEVRIGGFGGVAGLRDALHAMEIDAVIDATHPFAAVMSVHAAQACAAAAIPLLAVMRPAWDARDGDDWHTAQSREEAAALCDRLGSRIFLTTGRQEIRAFAQCAGWFLIRTIDPPQEPLPAQHELLLARGPFKMESEIALMRDRRIDLVVSKNSGGDATYAKIAAARELRIPVVMLQRPARPTVASVTTAAAAAAWARALRATRSRDEVPRPVR